MVIMYVMIIWHMKIVKSITQTLTLKKFHLVFFFEWKNAINANVCCSKNGQIPSRISFFFNNFEKQKKRNDWNSYEITICEKKFDSFFNDYYRYFFSVLVFVVVSIHHFIVTNDRIYYFFGDRIRKTICLDRSLSSIFVKHEIYKLLMFFKKKKKNFADK